MTTSLLHLMRNCLFLTFVFFMVVTTSVADENKADKLYQIAIQQLTAQGYAGIDSAIADFNTIVATYPHHWRTRLGLANGYLLKYEFSEQKEKQWLADSLGHLNVVIKNRQLLSDAYFKRALVWLNYNKIADAKSDLQQALEIEPTYLEAHLIFLQLLLANNAPDTAGKKAALWIGNYPTGSPAPQRFGDIFIAAKDYKNALLYYQKALKHSPDDSVLLMSIGRSYQKLQNDAKASEAFEKVLQLAPENQEARFLNGVSLSNLVLLEAAVKEFEIYRKSSPKEISALNNLAVLYEKTGNPSKAKSMWLKVKQLSSNSEYKQRAENNLLRLLQSSRTKKKVKRSIPPVSKKVEADDEITALMNAERKTQSAQPASQNNNFAATGGFDVYNNYSTSHAAKLQQADQMAEFDMQNILAERQAAEAERLQKMQRDQEIQGQAMEWQALLDKQASDSARKAAEWEATHSFGAYATSFLGTIAQTAIGSFTGGVLTPVATTLANKTVKSLFNINPKEIDNYNKKNNNE